MGQDDGSRPDVDVVFDDDGASRQSRLRAFARSRVVVGDVAAEVDVLADLHAAADEDVARVFDGAVRSDVSVVADADVVAVVAGERVVDDDSGADAAWAGLRVVVVAILVVGFVPCGWIEDAPEETAFFVVAGGARVAVGLVPAFDGCFA